MCLVTMAPISPVLTDDCPLPARSRILCPCARPSRAADSIETASCSRPTDMRAARCAQLLALCIPLCQRRGEFLVPRTCSVSRNKLRQVVRAQLSHLFREQFPDATETALLVLACRQLASD